MDMRLKCWWTWTNAVHPQSPLFPLLIAAKEALLLVFQYSTSELILPRPLQAGAVGEGFLALVDRLVTEVDQYMGAIIQA
jgi:hypothetical protein